MKQRVPADVERRYGADEEKNKRNSYMHVALTVPVSKHLLYI